MKHDTYTLNSSLAIGATMAPIPENVSSAKRLCLSLGLGAALLLNACGGGGTTSDQGNGTIAAASATGLRALPAVFTNSKAVSYSPYRTATTDQGRANETIDPNKIKQDLDLLVTAGIGLIRLFDSSDKVALATLQVIEKYNLPIKVMLGVYVGSFEYATDPVVRARVQAANQDEMARGVTLAKAYPQVVAVSVGNETMVSWSSNAISTTAMAGYIKTVRDQITQPVTSDDNYAFYAGNTRNASEQVADVLRQIDFASIHTYSMLDAQYSNTSDNDPLPDWDWQQIGVSDLSKRAAAMMDAAIGKTQTDYTRVRSFLDKSGRANLPIVIGETGWKGADSGGSGLYKYQAHPANQKMYYGRLLDWAIASRSNNGPKGIVYFEAFDEKWKGNDDKWGLFTKDRTARCAAQALNPSASWIKDTTACADSDALYFVPPVITAAVPDSKLTIFNELVSGYPVGMKADAYEVSTFHLTYPATGDSAPSDLGATLGASKYLSIDTFTPKSYGWGLLWQSSATPAASTNLSNFASGSIRFSIKTAYAGSLRVGISSNTELGEVVESFVLVSNGNYGYCSSASPGWCDVSIPLSAFLAANPKLDLRLVLTRFSISDVYTSTGNADATGKPAIALDNIYWTR